jgi:hypothetical protein
MDHIKIVSRSKAMFIVSTYAFLNANGAYCGPMVPMAMHTNSNGSFGAPHRQWRHWRSVLPPFAIAIGAI